MPLVSVIIPTFNRANLVTEAIDSILNQSFKGFEIIVVDDGSKDNTREVVITRYGSQISYIYQKNRGLSCARNAGIKASTGRYLAFLDDDDLWLPDKLERQVNLINKLPERIGMVYCSAYVKKRGHSKIREAKHKGNILKDLLFANVVIGSASAALIRRECFDKVGLFDESLKRSEDRDMWLRISEYYDFDFVKEPLVTLRHLDSHMMTDLKRLDNMFVVLDKVFDDPTCPQDIKELRNKAYASRLLDFMGGYYSNNKVFKVWECFVKAVYYDRTSIKMKHIGIILKAPLRAILR